MDKNEQLLQNLQLAQHDLLTFINSLPDSRRKSIALTHLEIVDMFLAKEIVGSE